MKVRALKWTESSLSGELCTQKSIPGEEYSGTVFPKPVLEDPQTVHIFASSQGGSKNMQRLSVPADQVGKHCSRTQNTPTLNNMPVTTMSLGETMSILWH